MSRPIKFLLLLLALFLLLITSYFLWQQYQIKQINSFSDCAKAGYPIMESFPPQCRTPDGRNFVDTNAQGQELTVTGELVCLPHKDTDGPQTLECAFGIKDANDDHYALSDPEMTYLTNLEFGKRVNVTGTFRTDTNSIYDILGVLEIINIEQD